MGDRHGWATWQNYEAAHEGNLARFSHFIRQNDILITATSTRVRLAGELLCVAGIEIHVNKTLELDAKGARRKVQTLYYAYHVLQRSGASVLDLFRYDNIHRHPEHPDNHHRHRFDLAGAEILPTTHVGRPAW